VIMATFLTEDAVLNRINKDVLGKALVTRLRHDVDKSFTCVESERVFGSEFVVCFNVFKLGLSEHVDGFEVFLDINETGLPKVYVMLLVNFVMVESCDSSFEELLDHIV